MFSITLIWFFLKRTSKFIAFLLGIVSFTLLLFVQLSCISPSLGNDYALKLFLNKDSAIYSIVNNTFNDEDYTTGFANLDFKIGISGICISNLPVTISTPFVQTEHCYKHNYNFSSIVLADDINFYDSLSIQILNSNTKTTNTTIAKTEVNLIDLAKGLSKSIHPNLTVCSLVFNSLTLLTIIITLIPKPWNIPYIFTTPAYITYLLIDGLSVIVCFVNAIYLRQCTDKVYSSFLTKVSLNIIKTQSGKRFERLIWISLIFQVFGWFSMLVSFIRYYFNMNEEIDEMKQFDISRKEQSKEEIKGQSLFSNQTNPFSDYMNTEYQKYENSVQKSNSFLKEVGSTSDNSNATTYHQNNNSDLYSYKL
ncbi:hypothetical protein ACO0OL_001137 [Hanseniaspora opuntiae]